MTKLNLGTSSAEPRGDLMRHIILCFTSGFYSGYIPFASGTFGTMVAIVLYWPLARFNQLPSDGGNLWLYAIIVAVVSVLGIWGSTYAENIYKKKDSGKIVIDEIVGFFVTMFLIPFTWQWIAAAFFVFRAFDVLKPWPIDNLQKIKGGTGVVIDDLLAGVYSCILLHAIRLGITMFAE